MVTMHHRLAIAGVIAATAIAVPAAALASGTGSPPGKPAPPTASAASAAKSAAAKSGAAASGPAPSQGAKKGQPDRPPAPVAALAARLGVSVSAAGRAYKEITGLSGTHSVEVASPAFAAIARDLGVTPARLAAAWNAVGRR